MSMLGRLIATVAAVLLFASGSFAQAAAKEFFRPHAPALAKSARPDRAPGVVSDALPIAFNADEMLGLRRGEEIQLTLPNAVSRAVVFEGAQSHGGGVHSWVGHFKQRGKNNRVILTTGPSGSYGVIETPDGTYRVVPGNGTDWLVDMTQEQLHIPILPFVDDARIPPPTLKAMDLGEPSLQYALGGVAIDAMPMVTPAPQHVIDLMVVVTQGLANKLGSNLMTRLYFLVTRSNTAYADSEVAITLRLVKVSVVNYSDATDNGDALDAITPIGGGGTGVFASVEAQRAAAGADLVALMRDGSNFGGSGVAWVGNPPIDPRIMYSVTTGCVSGCESVFIHEVGHNMGNKHDRYTDAFQRGVAPTGTYFGPAFPSGYGYAFCKSGALSCAPFLTPPSAGTCSSQPECSTEDPSNFSDIMAYFQGTTETIYRFSNSALSNCASPTAIDGLLHTCGINPAQPDSADTASSMNSNRTNLSAVKTQVSAAQMPGSIQFTQTSFSGPESGGTITFTVSRMRDSTIAGGGGIVSVQYAVTSGSATVGTDFTDASGTLTWQDGDFSPKLIPVTITNDATVEGAETFTATLSNPTGAAGVFLGYPTTAMGTILEAWPPGGAAPAGFSSASTPTLPWAVVTDSFDAGGGDTFAFKSAAFASSATGNSSTVYTGTFAAGLVTFAYRVSSYPGAGFFEFVVDGTVVLTDSGDTGLWESFSTNITGGPHTLEWRYRKILTFACANAVPGGSPPGTPPSFPNCQDRVWIDSVVLPAPGAPPANPPRLGNISTRMQALTGNDVMIAGFIIGGSAAKTVVINVAGPSLVPFGIPNALMNPTLSLVRSSDQAVLKANDNWQAQGIPADVAAIQASGFQPNNTAEPAIIATLAPGAYTAIVQGAGGTTGVGLVGVFEVDQPEVPLVNISTRGQVLTGNDVMIAGFIIQGSTSQTVVINVAGPSLVPFGIPNALVNPTLTLVRSSDQAVLKTNDNWQTQTIPGDVAAIQATGFQPNNTAEPALIATLAPGAYTAIVQGAAGGTGVALVGVFTTP